MKTLAEWCAIGRYQNEWEPGSKSATQRHLGSFGGTGPAKVPSYNVEPMWLFVQPVHRYCTAAAFLLACFIDWILSLQTIPSAIAVVIRTNNSVQNWLRDCSFNTENAGSRAHTIITPPPKPMLPCCQSMLLWIIASQHWLGGEGEILHKLNFSFVKTGLHQFVRFFSGVSQPFCTALKLPARFGSELSWMRCAPLPKQTAWRKCSVGCSTRYTRCSHPPVSPLGDLNSSTSAVYRIPAEFCMPRAMNWTKKAPRQTIHPHPPSGWVLALTWSLMSAPVPGLPLLESLLLLLAPCSSLVASDWLVRAAASVDGSRMPQQWWTLARDTEGVGLKSWSWHRESAVGFNCWRWCCGDWSKRS